MQCPNCGHVTEKAMNFCPRCGAPQTETEQAPAQADMSAPAVQASQEILQAERAAYVRPDYDPARDGRLNPPPAGNPAGPGRRPPTTGMVVFSIINMLCCGLGIGFILGLIALVLAVNSSSESSFEEAERKLHTARTLNLIGLVFLILGVVAFFCFVVMTIILRGEFSYY